MTTLILLLILIVAMIVAVGLAKDLLYAAVGLALASVFLAGVLFHQGAYMAAAFELSVCAGLITVLFVATVSLTKDSDQKQESQLSRRLLPAFLFLFVAFDFFAVEWVQKWMNPGPLPSNIVYEFRNTFWATRATDILGQVSLILAGVFAILALFKRAPLGRKHD